VRPDRCGHVARGGEIHKYDRRIITPGPRFITPCAWILTPKSPRKHPVITAVEQRQTAGTKGFTALAAQNAQTHNRQLKEKAAVVS
jgi:hypothetical protein